MVDFEAMATFVAVVRNAGFRGAATSMHIPRSTVSHRVARLEDELGVRLIERTTRKLRMTAVGEAFFDRCVRILADVEEAHLSVTNAQRAPQGTLRVACTLLFGHLYMARIAADFMRKYPDVEIEIVAANRRVNLIEEGFDLAVVVMGANEDSSMLARKLTISEVRCCASPAYVAARGLPSQPEDVASHSCIAYGDSRQTTWRFERPGEARSIALRGRMSVNSLMMAHTAALRGVGIAALPTFLCNAHLRDGRLVSVLPDWVISRSEMRVIYPSNRYLAPRVRLFVEALVGGYTDAFENGWVNDGLQEPPVIKAHPPGARSGLRKGKAPKARS
jgi:DNA-binding transcriptional LysR family regulator